MVEVIPDLPANVLGFTASGEITEQDYTETLVPAVEKMFAEHEKVRMLYVIGPEFTKASCGAMMEDCKLGFRHLRGWEKMAIVSDVEWIRHSIHVFGWMMPSKVKTFNNAELDQAKEWVSS